MQARSATELKRRLAVHAINLANFKADLEKSEKIRKEFLTNRDNLQAGLAEEVSNAHRKTIERIKELIIEDSKALAEVETSESRHRE